MEAFKINVELSASSSLLSAINGLTEALKLRPTAPISGMVEEPKAEQPKLPKIDLNEPTKVDVPFTPTMEVKAEEPKTEEAIVTPTAKVEEPVVTGEDMPEFITDAELRIAVKEAKDRTSASDVKTIFATFGIKSSPDCPQDRRAELLQALKPSSHAI